jgi:hypothetical protein
MYICLGVRKDYSRTLLRSLSRDQRIRDFLRGKLIKSNRILGLQKSDFLQGKISYAGTSYPGSTVLLFLIIDFITICPSIKVGVSKQQAENIGEDCKRENEEPRQHGKYSHYCRLDD